MTYLWLLLVDRGEFWNQQGVDPQRPQVSPHTRMKIWTPISLTMSLWLNLICTYQLGHYDHHSHHKHISNLGDHSYITWELVGVRGGVRNGIFCLLLVKFRYSEKATKFREISILLLTSTKDLLIKNWTTLSSVLLLCLVPIFMNKSLHTGQK